MHFGRKLEQIELARQRDRLLEKSSVGHGPTVRAFSERIVLVLRSVGCDFDDVSQADGVSHRNRIVNGAASPAAVRVSPAGLKTTAMLEHFSGVKKRGQAQRFSSPG